MQKTQKKKTFFSRMLVFCLSVALMLTTFAMPALAEDTETQMCKVTFSHDNSANIEGEAYNTLQFYVNGGDYHDIVSGEELPLGTEVCYFVVSRASAMNMKVTHNGQVVEDVVVPYDVQDTERTLTLEGDLDITTEVITAETKFSLSVDNQVGGEPEIYMDDTSISSGALVSQGTHSFSIYTDYVTDELAEALVTLKVNGVQVGEPTEIGYTGAEFADVNVTGNVSIVISAPGSEEETTYNVTVNRSDDVPGDIMVYADSDDITDVTDAKITAGTHSFTVYGDYSEGQEEATVTLKVNGEVLGSETDLNGYTGIEFSNIEVNGDVVIDITMPVKYTVNIVDNVKDESISYNVMSLDWSTGSPVPLPVADGDTVGEGQYLGVQIINPTDKKLIIKALDKNGKVVDSFIVDAATAEEEGAGGLMYPQGIDQDITFVLDIAPVTYKVKVTNGAASANTDYNVNGLHVYDNSAGSDMDDIFGEVDLEAGTPVEIYAYPTASAINLKVVHNGETIFDKNLNRITAWVDDDKIEWINIDSLEGDLEVTTEAISSYEINIEDKVKDDNVTFNVATVDFSEGTPKQVVLSDGDALFEGDMVASNVINDSDKILKLTATKNSDGSVIDEKLILPGYANGIYIMEVDASVKFTLEESTDKIAISKVTLKNSSKTYTGSAIKFDNEITVTAKINGEDVTLKKGTDYTLAYKNNTNAGKATVTVTGKGFFEGTITKNFTINAKDISKASVTGIKSSYAFTSSAIKPEVTVKDGKVKLEEGKDYTVKYANNVKNGKATVTITGKGNYAKSVSKNFTITGGTGLYKNGGKWKYYVKGTFKKSTGLVKRPDNGKWYYVSNGIYKKSTGLVKKTAEYKDTKWYYVSNGSFNNKATGLTQKVVKTNDKGWYYVKNGKFLSSFNGKAKKITGDKKVYNVKKGKLVTK